MRYACFHHANQITKDLKGVQDNIKALQETQQTALSAIEENQCMMSQVANHIAHAYNL